jgi:hypothetical protein
MRAKVLEFMSLALIGLSIFAFYTCLRHLTDRDYVGAILIMFIGFALIRVGSDFARLSLWDGKE